jgi:hypothetical protein
MSLEEYNNMLVEFLSKNNIPIDNGVTVMLNLSFNILSDMLDDNDFRKVVNSGLDEFLINKAKHNGS